MNIYGSFIPETFSQAELDKRIARAHARHDATTVIEAPDLSSFLTTLTSLQAERYTLDTSFLPVAIPMGGFSTILTARLTKPQALIKRELLVLTTETTEAYHAYLAEQQAIAVEAMTNRLIGEAKAKRDKEAQQAETELREHARLQALEILNIQESN